MALPTPEDLKNMTPMMNQYFSIKSECPDAILFFRMGDFFEIFGDDAIEVAPKLDIVLTSRERGDQNRIKFCGVPHHSAANYWRKLVQLGYRVAIADQVEKPCPGKNLVARKIIKIFSPGCLDELEALESSQPNYTMAFYQDPQTSSWAVAACDISTGEFRVGQIEFEGFRSLLETYQPREILVRRFCRDWLKDVLFPKGVGDAAPLFVDLDEAALREPMSDEFLEHSKGFLASIGGGIPVASGMAAHLKSMKFGLARFLGIKPLFDEKTAVLDEITIRDLEIFETVRSRRTQTSLFAVMNSCLTPMGARFLRWSLARLQLDPQEILTRQQAIATLVDSGEECLTEIRQALKKIGDLERLSTRLAEGIAKPIEMYRIAIALASALELLEKLKSRGLVDVALTRQTARLALAHETYQQLSNSLLADNVGQLGKGSEVFRPGFDSELDRLNGLAGKGQEAIDEYEQDLKVKTSIASLKIKPHKTYGLLIDVTKSNLGRIPDYFIRRQTMVNSERFTTEDLLSLEETISSAHEQAIQREEVLYQNLSETLRQFHPQLREVSEAIALVDFFQSCAYKAVKRKWVCPQISDAGINLRASRHPVVEEQLGAQNFIANDIELDQEQKFALLTGPNMAGKSTVMRQVAIAGVLCQIGSFIPAREAILPVFDQIYTRVGASDDLAAGISTFMAEMTECARILRRATGASLVILDEVGRGTSTEDGLGIALGIMENVVGSLGSWSFFATHYHDLVPLAKGLAGVKQLTTEVIDRDGELVFTHRLISGAARSSFGLEVARRAGIPAHVVARAREFIDGHAKPKSLVVEYQGDDIASLVTLVEAAVVEQFPQLDSANFLDALRKKILSAMQTNPLFPKSNDLYNVSCLGENDGTPAGHSEL